MFDEPVETPGEWENSSSSFDEDISWVYSNLGNRKLKAADAPSGGARTLMEFAKEFLTMMFKHSGMPNSESEQKKIFRDDKHRTLGYLDEFIEDEFGRKPDDRESA